VPAIHVVAGALLREGRVLIAQRPPGKHMAGGWEFPGGKLADAEMPLDGLMRELKEELGIVALSCEPVAQCTHEYPDRHVLLDLWLVREFTGEPQSLDGQALKWISLHALPEAELLPADAPLVAALLKYLSQVSGLSG
jgi:8-oxo-dGTP diphosphatase